MKMTRSREMLSLLLQLVTAVCTAVLIYSFLLNITVVNVNYYAQEFPAAQYAADCEARLSKNYEMLAKESGFPVRVFERVKTDMPTAQMLQTHLASLMQEDEPEIYNENLVAYFYHLCEDFAKGNQMQYREADLRVTAEKAARIYSDTVGLRGFENANVKYRDLRQRVTLAQLVSFIAGLLCCACLMLMYTRRRLSYFRILTALMTGGIASLMSSGVLYLLKPVEHLDIQPAAFTQCLSDMADKFFIVVAMFSVAVIMVSLIFTIRIEQQYLRKKDTVKITK